MSQMIASGLLTPQQFKATAAGEKPGASYSKYAAWVNKTRAARAQQRASSLGLNTNDYDALQYLSSLLKPGAGDAALTQQQLNQQARTAVQAAVNPELKQINTMYDNQEKSGSDLINSIGATLAARLASYGAPVDAAYQAEEGKLAGAGDALSSYLQGVGSNDGSRLAAELSKAGLPSGAVSAAQGAASGVAGGGAKVAAASGFTNLADALGNEASDTSFFGRLPAIGDLQTGASERDFLTGIENSRAQDLGQVTSQIPGLEQTLFSQLQQNELTKAGNRDQSQQALAQLAASFLGGIRDNASALKIAGLNNAASAAQQAASIGEQRLEHTTPSADTTAQIAATQAANHADAVKQRNADVQSAKVDIANMAAQNAAGQVVQTQQPVLATNAAARKQGKPYVRKGGDPILGPFTADPAQAETKLVKSVSPGLGYKALFQRAWSLYGQNLMATYGMSAAAVKQVIDEALAAAGVTPTKTAGKK